jgi:hypothetical protein
MAFGETPITFREELLSLRLISAIEQKGGLQENNRAAHFVEASKGEHPGRIERLSETFLISPNRREIGV